MLTSIECCISPHGWYVWLTYEHYAIVIIHLLFNIHDGPIQGCNCIYVLVHPFVKSYCIICIIPGLQLHILAQNHRWSILLTVQSTFKSPGECECVTMVDCALSEVAYVRVVFLRVYDSTWWSGSSGLCIILFIITWPIFLLRNRPTVRPRPARLNTPDNVACQPKSMTRATSQIL